MSATPNPDSSIAAAAGGGSTADASQFACVLVDLKKHAEKVFEDLQADAHVSGADDTLKLWDCVRQRILDDQSGRSLFRQFIKKNSAYCAKKDEVLRLNSTLQDLVASLAPGEAQDDDIEEERAKVEKLVLEREDALAELRIVRLTLYKSILASVACRFGTETQPSAFFTEQVAKARALPKEQDPLKHIQSVVKEAVSVCWQAHGVKADRQEKLKEEWAKLEGDDDLKLLKPAAKWPNSWCKNEFEPGSKPTPLKAGKAANVPTPAPVSCNDSATPASGCITLADVTGPVEQKPADGKSAHTELLVPVKITCDKLCKGHLIRIKAVDCAVGGQIAYFVKQDGKKATKLPEANGNECVTLVLQVMYQPGLLISEKPHADMRITPFDDDDHSRWYKAMMMLDELREAASPWVEQVVKDMWRDIKQELLGGSSKEDGSTLAASSLPYFPLLKDDGSYTMGGVTVVPTASEVLWFEAIMRRHADPSNTKVVNSQLKLWAHPDQGYIEVMKLFCNTLGGHDSSKYKRCVADLDAEAVFKIIFNCKAFHGAVGPASPSNPVKAAASDAGFARNTTIHAPTPNLGEKEYEIVVKQLSSFEKMLVQCGVLDASSRLVCNMKWMEANLADEKHAEIIKLYQRIKELRNRQLRHDVLDQLLPPQPNVRGDRRRLLLQTAEDSIFKLQNDWAPGSREALKAAVASGAAADDSRVKLLWLHAQRGRGKSSLMAQLTETRAWAPGTTCVVRHFFKRDDAASSLNIATASMCVQLWHHFFQDDLETAYSLFDNCMLASDGTCLDDHELSAALNRQSLTRITGEVLMKLLSKIDGSVTAPVSIVMQFDALDEVAHRQLQVDSPAGSPFLTTDTTKFKNPHHALYSEIFGPLLAQVAALQHVSVVILVSSTQPWLGAAAPYIHQISVDDDAFLPAEDAQCIVTHKIRSYWPTCKWTADVAAILCKLIPRKSPDLRFLDTRCKLVIESTKKWLQCAPTSADETMSAEVEEFLQAVVDRTGDMSLAQVVQIYVFQEMHFAFPEADLAAWEQRVNVAFDALLLAAFFGVDSFRTDMLHLLVCNSEQTSHEFESLLLETLYSITVSPSCDGEVRFQPEYMDAFRSSAITSGGYSNVRRVMELVYSSRSRSSSDPSSLSWSEKLTERFKSACFDKMSQCFAKASDLTDRCMRILAVDQGKSRKLDELPAEFFGFMTQSLVDTSCPCALECILQALDLRLGSSDCSFDLKFYFRVCENLRRCAALDKCSGLMQYRAREVAGQTAANLQRRVCCFEGKSGRQLAQMIKSSSCATWLFGIFAFLQLNASGFDLAGALGKAQQLMEDGLEDGFVPAKLRLFLCVLRFDPSQRSIVEKLMRESELNDTDVWNVRLMSQQDTRQRLQLFAVMKKSGVPQDSFTRSIIIAAHLSSPESMESLMKESRDMGILPGVLDWNLYMKACKYVEQRESCMTSMKTDGLTPDEESWNTLISGYVYGKERYAVLQRMAEAGVTPSHRSWHLVMSRYRTGVEQNVVLLLMVKAGVTPNQETWNMLMDAYRTGKDRNEVMRRMVKAGVTPNLHSWNTLMLSYCTGKECNEVMRRMVEAGVTPNLQTWNTLMSGYCTGKERNEVMRRMVEAGVTPNLQTWNTLMSGYVTGEERHAVLQRMAEAGVEPSERIWNIVMSGYVTGEERHAMLQPMVKAGVTPSKWTWNIVMSGYVTGEERHAVLRRMVEASVEPDHETWSTLMEGFAHDEMPMKCLSSFLQMDTNPSWRRNPMLFDLIILFSCLVRDGSGEAMCTLAHISALPHVSTFMIDHFLAPTVLSALAIVDSEICIMSFWSVCAKKLSCSKEGWPGQENEKLLRSRCRRNGTGWEILLSLIDGTRSADDALCWPPTKNPPAKTRMIYDAVELDLLAVAKPFSSSVSDGSSKTAAPSSKTKKTKKTKELNPSALPFLPPAASQATSAAGPVAAAPCCSRSITCTVCRYVFTLPGIS